VSVIKRYQTGAAFVHPCACCGALVAHVHHARRCARLAARKSVHFAVGRLPWLRCGALGDRVCRQGGDGGGGSGGEVSWGWKGRGSYELVVIGDGAGDDGRTSVEGLLYVVRTRVEGVVLE